MAPAGKKITNLMKKLDIIIYQQDALAFWDINGMGFDILEQFTPMTDMQRNNMLNLRETLVTCMRDVCRTIISLNP